MPAARALKACFALWPLWLGSATQVWAEPRIAELALEAEPDCVTESTLLTGLRAQAWQLHARPEPAAELSLTASVREAAPGELAVELRVSWPDGRSAARALAAHSCEAARDALLLLVHMTLDAADAARPSAPDSAAAAAPLDESAPFTVERLSLGASLGLASGTQPGAATALALVGALGLRGTGFLRPRVQLELSHAWRNSLSAASGRADVALDGGQLWLCPIGLRSAGWGAFAAHGCGAFELARLRAHGYDTYAPRTVRRPWASAGVGVLLALLPLSKLELQLGAALLAPLWRDELSFAPDVFYAVPAWRWQLKFGVALSFL